MTWIRLAWNNLARRPVRTSLTAVGVGLATAVAVSLGGFNLGFRSAIARSIEQLGFQVMVMAKGCPYEAATLMLKGGTGLLYLPESAYEQIRTDPDIEAITPVFLGVAEKPAGGMDEELGAPAFALIAGIEPESYRTMKPWLRFQSGPGYDGGRWFSPESTDEAVMGFEAAQYEQRKVGDLLYLSVVPHGRSEPELHTFRIVGVLERTGSQDDGTVFLPLRTAQRIFGREGQLTIVGGTLRQFNAIRMREFEGRWMSIPEVQVVSLEQVKGALVSLVGTAQTMVAAVAVIAVIVAMIGVLNAILMSVYERTAEFGILKAIGAERRQIFRLVCLETLLLALSGAVGGSVVAVAGVRLTDAALRRLLNLGVSQPMVLITPRLLAVSILGAVALGLLAALWPAARAASLRPVEAIRGQE